MPSAKNLGGGTTVDARRRPPSARRFNGPLVHESVRAELAAKRQGTASTKTRGEVRGGGAKPWRQKGTGRARAGSSRSPMWTGGGTVFGPKPRHYTFKVNRKERRAAFRSALSIHAERGSIAVFDPRRSTTSPPRRRPSWSPSWPQGLAAGRPRRGRGAAALSFRNLARPAVVPTTNVGVADLVGAANVLVSPARARRSSPRAPAVRRRDREEASA